MDQKTTNDPVNNPQHYADLFTNKPTQCRAIARLLGFDPGNVIKYTWRAGNKSKDKTKEDLLKAVNYLNDWEELYDILLYHDIGNFEAARVLFAQIEKPDINKDPVAFRKWDIIRAVLIEKDGGQTTFDYIYNCIDSLCVMLTGARLK